MTDITIFERPIIFSVPMIREILAGNKTQTRRVLNPQPERFAAKDDPGPFWHFRRKGWPEGRIREDHMSPLLEPLCPYGRAGDRLWVREAFFCNSFDYPAATDHARENLLYRADAPHELEGESVEKEGGWKPSIHMPRWASRITLEITAIKVERVGDITEEDARAEGAQAYIQSLSHGPRTEGKLVNAACYWTKRLPPNSGVCHHRGYFAAAWDHINGKREGCSFADNPWVFVVEFRVAEVNV